MRPLLILDLDETLWHGVTHELFTIRPYVSELVIDCAVHYDIAVWTAATEGWAKAGMNHLLKETGLDLLKYAKFVWYRDMTELVRIPNYAPYAVSEYSRTKPLSKLAKFKESSQYSLDRVIALDDYETNFSDHRENLILVGEWKGDQSDFELMAVRDFLISAAGRPDMRVGPRYISPTK